MQTITFHRLDSHPKYEDGDIVLYKHTHYNLKLFGRIMYMVSEKDLPEEQTDQNSHASLMQLDWIKLPKFKSLEVKNFPRVNEFVETERRVEIPLKNLIRRFPSVEITDPKDYCKSFIDDSFTSTQKNNNPIILRFYELSSWEPPADVPLMKAVLKKYDDLIPCCNTSITLLWESCDLSDKTDDFYHLMITPILTPLIRADIRYRSKPSVDFIWSNLVCENQNIYEDVERRNAAILRKTIPGRTEALIDKLAYVYLLDLIHHTKILYESETPAPVVALFYKYHQDVLLPALIDTIDEKVTESLKKPTPKEEEEECGSLKDAITDDELDDFIESDVEVEVTLRSGKRRRILKEPSVDGEGGDSDDAPEDEWDSNESETEDDDEELELESDNEEEEEY